MVPALAVPKSFIILVHAVLILSTLFPEKLAALIKLIKSCPS